MRSLDIHLGKEAETPAIKTCENPDCGNELPYTAKFCGRCGHQQSIETMRGRPGDQRAEAREIFTADGKQVEIDLQILVLSVDAPILRFA